MRPLLVIDPGRLGAPEALRWVADLLPALPPTDRPSGIALVLPATAVMAVRPLLADALRSITPAVRAESVLSAAVAMDAGAGLLFVPAPMVVPGAPLIAELPRLHPGSGASETVAEAVRASHGEPVVIPLPSPFDAPRRAALAAVVRSAGGRGLLIAGAGPEVDAAIAEGTIDGACVELRDRSLESVVAHVMAFDRAVRAR